MDRNRTKNSLKLREDVTAAKRGRPWNGMLYYSTDGLKQRPRKL
jgi:hypothetical protein